MEQSVIKQLQQEIFTWYAQHQRRLPWRELPFDTALQQRDPYRILISEVMSQQTQISRVIPKYEIWLTQFPTVKDLAAAQASEVLRYWSGLGYNRRAINLQRAAKVIMNDYNGDFPREVSQLIKLPGIGEYTASAIACFAFNQQIAVVDTNVRKVILTKLSCNCEEWNDLPAGRQAKQSPLAMTEKEIKNIAERLLPEGQAYEWNQALMDYAAAMLKKEKIPVAKQSTFKGSNRYYRGQIVKILLMNTVSSILYLANTLEKEQEFIEKIVQGLVKDGLVKRTNGRVSLS